MPFVDLEGVRFHYQQKGRGEDVVLIHAVTSNMAIVPTTNTQISAYASDPAYLILDLSGYFAP